MNHPVKKGCVSRSNYFIILFVMDVMHKVTQGRKPMSRCDYTGYIILLKMCVRLDSSDM